MRLSYFPALVLLLLLPLFLTACDGDQEAPSIARPVMVVQPMQAAVRMSAYAGEVRARQESPLAFRVGGKVSKRLVDSGDQVKAGQPLAELETHDFLLQQDAREAQLAAASASFKQVRTERERYLRLLQQKLISPSQFETADNQYKSAEARFKQAQADLELSRNQLEYAVLRAPVAGVITAQQVEVGQVVSPGQPLFRLAADGEREVLFALPEQRIKDVRIGQPAMVELWSQPGMPFGGRIRELSATADPLSRTYAVRVALDAIAPAPPLGQSVQVWLEVNEGQVPSLSVPLSAVSADAGSPYVWVLDRKQSRVKRRAVNIGSYDEREVTILEGLQADEWVVTNGVQMLIDGQPVRALDRSGRELSTPPLGVRQ
ncbi:efflux transporter periplasmic adaptor subunit [Ventosimonas gracilis]|uniref:Efflux transporter periplasmic adaptor subunit n=1 Tax=Ventosimonas gracilis TaxID=1680762 RepID=A0A139SSZ0_9GAMM|nr:efflux RND transporter periplasmic adaptor subunit [Ventosimonas gracilis]KXU37570.1 efflux transporter periplasmic adaptor subunit [Ventosimonas gracilis]